ncbi:hypothetical protein Pint_06787 [Pistacia integerrima]|uniref:Uncharacterized protein n=1 Tax=Pistacia integerrima TaxID=434235 RepID=A0ACC0XZQ2_9ROSI|nr:hypothetical protein Pint_06787 [Pistacia integerrima]
MYKQVKEKSSSFDKTSMIEPQQILYKVLKEQFVMPRRLLMTGTPIQCFGHWKSSFLLLMKQGTVY